MNNQRNFFDWFAKTHNIQTQNDWYAVRAEDIVENGGMYSHSPSLSSPLLSLSLCKY